jgi:uncharacterized protein YbgA (DUF1722 family)/uncharacterized protein YbbK (DUF523 family)
LEPAPVRVGISACLLGQPVRYDGRDKRSAFLVERLGPHVAWVPVCPELEVGMGVPRESVHLVRHGERIGMFGTRSSQDWTARMEALAAARVDQLAGAELAGYVLKARSPSCGLAGVPQFAAPVAQGDLPVAEGAGLFAAALRRRLPDLPVVEESAFEEPQPLAREAFLTALFAHQRLQVLWATPFKFVDLVDFHTRHKMLLLAHQQTGYRALGRFLASASTLPRDQLKARYQAEFLAILRHPAHAGAHANVLDHLAGHCSRALGAPERAQLKQAIEDYRAGKTPRLPVIQLLRKHAARYELTYVREQLYLAPYPEPLFSDV